MKALLLKLSANCPFGDKLSDCPLSHMNDHKKTVGEMSHYEVEKVMTKHRDCIEKRSNTSSLFEKLMSGFQMNEEVICGYD